MTTTTPTTTTSNSGGVLQSLGIGSGLDISTLTTELTTAEMTPDNNRVTREQTAVTAQVSALGTLKSALSVFQGSLDALTTDSSFNARLVSSANTDVLTATGTSKAAIGNYAVTVKQLAQSTQLASTVFTAGASSVVGTGTLSLSLGSNNFNVSITSSNNTLTGIRDAINSASDNPGISATLVYGNTGAQLLLTSSVTGAANTITVNQSGGDGGLAALTYSGTNTANYTVKANAQDSIISIGGVDHNSASNTVSDAIDGMTLTLKSAQPDTPVSLSVSNDTAHVTSLVQSFVTAYNSLAASLTSLGKYDSTTQTAGPMLGDPLLNSLQNQISHALSDVVAGTGSTYNSLGSLGVTKNVDGTLSLDSNKLNAAMSTNFSSVANVLGGATGVVTRLNTLASKVLASDGSIQSRSTSLNTQQTSINTEQAAITARTAQVQARFLAKFNAMDSLLATLQSTSTFLTQQFNALNKTNNGS